MVNPLEALFHLHHITADGTMYFHVVGVLPQDCASRLLPYIRDPPMIAKYERLKALLLHTFCLSRRDRAAKILHMNSIGDLRPSTIMAKMLALTDGHCPCLLFERAFLEQMPDEVSLMLARADFSDSQHLTERADELWTHRWRDVCAFTRSTATEERVQPRRHRDEEQDQPIAEEAAQLPEVYSRRRWYYYHLRYGLETRRCRSPCSFQGNASADRL